MCPTIRNYDKQNNLKEAEGTEAGNARQQQAVSKENQLDILALEDIMGEIGKLTRRME